MSKLSTTPKDFSWWIDKGAKNVENTWAMLERNQHPSAFAFGDETKLFYFHSNSSHTIQTDIALKRQ